MQAKIEQLVEPQPPSGVRRRGDDASEPGEARERDPAALAKLRPTDREGATILATLSGATLLGALLAARPVGIAWVAGQVVLAAAMVKWFVVLHECGHGLLFRSRRLNDLAGHLASVFAVIPYQSWKDIHAKHHKWTGWQDLDPTTATLVPRQVKRYERVVLDFVWRAWIPFFSILYRTNNFWNLPRLSKMFAGQPRLRRAHARNAAVLVAVYAALVATVGGGRLVHLFGAGFLASLVFADPFLLLSQHTHIPMRLSGGEKVAAIPAREQEPYTRSLRFPDWFSRHVLIHFDAHELHHLYPFVPGYHLRRIDRATMNEFPWWTWVRAAKRLPATVLLFQNRRQSGAWDV